MKNYFLNLLIAIDQLLNAAFGRNHDVTISARAYIREMRGGSSWQRKAIDKLFFWQDGHCRQAFLFEYRRNRDWQLNHKDLV